MKAYKIYLMKREEFSLDDRLISIYLVATSESEAREMANHWISSVKGRFDIVSIEADIAVSTCDNLYEREIAAYGMKDRRNAESE